MKWRIIVVSSVLLNAVLLAAYLTNRRPEPVAVAPEARVQTNQIRTADKARSVRPLTLEVATNAFHWGSVESPDYREYIANLRAIGCPEETVRDIIIADVNKLFASRIAALYPSARDYKFWRVEDRVAREEDRAREQKRRELDREKRALLKELLGIDYEVEMARWSGRPDEDEWRLGFLSPEKQELLKSLQSKYRDMERALMADGGFRNPENRAKMAALRAQREAELAQALGPQDFQEYQLRNSWTARNMRENLTSFEPTEDEFRQIFDVRKHFDDQFGFTRDGGDQTMREQRQASQAKMEEQLRAVLGEDRFREYTLAQDDRFREIYDFTQRNDLPRSTADALLDIRKTAEQTRREIQNNNALSQEDQRLALLKVQEATLATVTETLGDKAGPYLQEDGRWVNRMGPRDNNNNNNNGPPFGPRGFDRGERGGRPMRR
jgi:hypothetical protein